MQVLENFNWIDIVIILLLLRFAYVGAKIGLTAELFKLLGTIVGIAIGLYFYNPISDAFIKYISIPMWLAQFVILFVIIVAIKVIFRYCIILLLKILNIQFVSKLERAGGLLVGLCNGCLLIGLALIAILVIPATYIQTSITEKSRLGPYLKKSSEATYRAIINVVTSRPLLPSQKVQNEQTQKPKK